MKIAIGIMAYNEERNIGAMISSLSEQTLFEMPEHEVSVHAVPNGCKDATAARASEALGVFAAKHPRTRAEVNEVEQAGKANGGAIWGCQGSTGAKSAPPAAASADARMKGGSGRWVRNANAGANATWHGRSGWSASQQGSSWGWRQ